MSSNVAGSSNFMDRLKQKNEQTASMLVKVHVNEVMVYGAPLALMIRLSENDVDIRNIPQTSYVFVRPEILEDHHIFRIIWRKDGRPFSAGWIEKEVEPNIGTNGVPFHEFVNGLYAIAKPGIAEGKQLPECEVVELPKRDTTEPGAA